MDQFYKKIISSGVVTPTDPAGREPLVGGHRGIGMHHTDEAAHTCNECRWGTPEDAVVDKGKCYVMKNKLGAIWQRAIPDYFNTTCELFEAGEADFRELV